MRNHRLVLAGVLSGLMFLQGCVGVALIGGGAAAVAANDRRTVGAQIDDKAIVVKATQQIKSVEGLTDAVHVNITSVNGTVLISGETPDAETRDKVLGAVRTVSGVRHTVNEIRIAPASTGANRANDTWLTGKVRAALIGAKNLDSAQVKVVTENATVYLMGLVNKAEGDAAAAAAAEVGGVERVVKLFEYLD